MIFYCATCGDAGVVEMSDDAITTMANCYCSQGKKQGWQLPEIPIGGWRHSKLKWEDYKPNSLSDRKQKIEWHNQRMKNAEEFWKTQAPRG